ncbi:ATP-binding protein [Dehalococcoidia bacterium]|nr:ATP-binding protein [Dehalococcoidia bacterium]
MTGKVLQRTMFETSRVLEYFTERELSYQTGHSRDAWPQVILKELMDNALDACENASVDPEIKVELRDQGRFFSMAVEDNGPGIQPELITKILNFQTRTSDKEAYVSPTRGAQGNALKTVFAIPYVLSASTPKEGTCEIESQCIRHSIRVRLDVIKQEPRIEHEQVAIVKNQGCRVSVWLDNTSIPDSFNKGQFLQMMEDYHLFNPHLSLRFQFTKETLQAVRSSVEADKHYKMIPAGLSEKVREALIAGYEDIDKSIKGNSFVGEDSNGTAFVERDYKATNPGWHKWKPNDFTSPLWYSNEDLKKLILSHVALAQDGGRDLTLREFVAQFRGLTSTAKQKVVISRLPGIKRLSDFVSNGDADSPLISALLENMRSQTRPVPPQNLGIIGEEHFRKCFEGREVKYTRKMGGKDNIPFVVEVAYIPDEYLEGVRFHFGLNFAPASSDPLQSCRLVHETKKDNFEGFGVKGLAGQYRVGHMDKIHIVCHMAYPRFRFKDRGKTILEMGNE